MIDAEQVVYIAKLRGMIWWLASDLAADDGDDNSTSDTWVTLAEKHWQQGLRYETRFIELS